MSDDEHDNVGDLSAFRKQKEKEEEEKARAEKDAADLAEFEYIKQLLGNIIEQVGDPAKTGTLFYVPMSDDDYSNYYTFESGYNEDGYYESTWEWEGFAENEDDEEDV